MFSSYINHSLAFVFYKLAFLRSFLFWFTKRLYPEVIVSSIKQIYVENQKRNILIWAYIITVFFCLVLQAILSAVDGRFCSSDQQDAIKDFCEDGYNFFNYVVVVPNYIFAGLLYLFHLATLDDKLNAFSIEGQQIPLSFGDDERDGIKYRGLWGILCILLFSLISISNYADHTLKLSKFQFWFHDTIQALPQNLQSLGHTSVVDKKILVFHSLRGYYYVLINYVLNVFFFVVAFCHFGLFFKTRSILQAFEKLCGDVEKMPDGIKKFLRDNNELSKFFFPFVHTTLYSKWFFAALVVNMITWHNSGVNRAYESGISDAQITGIVLIIIGGWLVAFPRFYIEYHLESIRYRLDQREQTDIIGSRMKRIFFIVNLVFISMFFKFFLAEIPFVKETLQLLL